MFSQCGKIQQKKGGVMIFYGVRRAYHGQKTIETVNCEKCGNPKFLLTNEYVAAHVFFIPFLAVSYNPVACCTKCKKRYTIKKFSKKYKTGMEKQDIKDLKEELYNQMTDVEKKGYKRKNTIGLVFAGVLLAFLFLLAFS